MASGRVPERNRSESKRGGKHANAGRTGKRVAEPTSWFGTPNPHHRPGASTHRGRNGGGFWQRLMDLGR